MNSLLKNIGKVVGVVGLSAGFVFIAYASEVHAGEKKRQTKKHAGDSFQFTLSNKVYSGDPQSKFVRQTCEPGQHKKSLPNKIQSGKKTGSGS